MDEIVLRERQDGAAVIRDQCLMVLATANPSRHTGAIMVATETLRDIDRLDTAIGEVRRGTPLSWYTCDDAWHAVTNRVSVIAACLDVIRRPFTEAEADGLECNITA